MGETTDLVLRGVLCECCGVLIDGQEVGYPRDCEYCLWELDMIKAHRTTGEPRM